MVKDEHKNDPAEWIALIGFEPYLVFMLTRQWRSEFDFGDMKP